ncbi:MAG: FAD-dependent oxidoreductase [Alphaproteobacteria bacterium]|nr:FAD-dependent oxidoreductase [Alphaproteobacteria bacterium]
MHSVAIIGSGISGISAAYLLKDRYSVTLFEKNDYFGGHSNTYLVKEPHSTVPIDTGFIVYNPLTYPNLVAFFDELQLNTSKTDMSFSVSLDKGRLEYAGTSLSQFFAQRKNLLSTTFLKMGLDILKFNRVSANVQYADISKLTLDEYVSRCRLSESFKHHYLYPMTGAIWSAPVTQVGAFSAWSIIQFFKNHGLLQIANHPQWQTVQGGSREYVKKALASPRIEKHLNCTIYHVRRMKSGIEIGLSEHSVRRFDHVVFATPAHVTARLLSDASNKVQDFLRSFTYTKNKAYLHRDPSFMPVREKIWSSWNYFNTAKDTVGVTYWMNRLQPFFTQENYFVTLNPIDLPAAHYLETVVDYEHPLLDYRAIEAQTQLKHVQGDQNTWFCGSYQGHGFHEDGFVSGLRVANHLGVKASWQN